MTASVVRTYKNIQHLCTTHSIKSANMHKIIKFHPCFSFFHIILWKPRRKKKMKQTPLPAAGGQRCSHWAFHYLMLCSTLIMTHLREKWKKMDAWSCSGCFIFSRAFLSCVCWNCWCASVFFFSPKFHHWAKYSFSKTVNKFLKEQNSLFLSVYLLQAPECCFLIN